MNRARILLADDHPDMRERVRRCLEHEFEVLDPVENGIALLKAAAKLKPDVCLLDISMPILDGIETASQLKERGCASQIVFLTIHEDPDFVQAALKTGALGYVIKRRIISDLRPAIHAALAGRRFISPLLFATDESQKTGPSTPA